MRSKSWTCALQGSIVLRSWPAQDASSFWCHLVAVICSILNVNFGTWTWATHWDFCRSGCYFRKFLGLDGAMDPVQWDWSWTVLETTLHLLCSQVGFVCQFSLTACLPLLFLLFQPHSFPLAAVVTSTTAGSHCLSSAGVVLETSGTRWDVMQLRQMHYFWATERIRLY